MNKLLQIGAIIWMMSNLGSAQDEARKMPAPRQHPNLSTKTLGGTQFWSDVLVQRDWRIQRNAWTGHHRLLDGQNSRHAWGSFDNYIHDGLNLTAADIERLKETLLTDSAGV